MFAKKSLGNGMSIVMESVPGVRSVAVGIWVKAGSRYEVPSLNGVSHFLEHMFFKGTNKRNAKDIAVAVDSIGADINAFTSKETTAFYVKVLDEYIEEALEILSDIFLNSTFPENEIETERDVIKEEIRMVEDTPDDLVHDIFSEAVWGKAGLGQPVLGTFKTLDGTGRVELKSYFSDMYGAENVIIACAGSIDEKRILAGLERHFGGHFGGASAGNGRMHEFRPGIQVVERDCAEAHICLGLKGIPQASQERYALSLLNTIFGSGASSFLFQEIREKRGLAYSVHSFTSMYREAGIWGVYAGTAREKVAEVLDITISGLRGLPDYVNEEELRRAKIQLRGNLLLSLESSGSVMQHIARQEIYYGRRFGKEEILAEVDAVTLPKIKDLASRLTSGAGIAVTALGPLGESEIKGIGPKI